MDPALRTALLEDLARIEDGTRAAAAELLRDESVPRWVEDEEAAEGLRRALGAEADVEAFKRIAVELVHIALHSALVAIDGGSASAEVGRVRLVDEAGEELVDSSLHEAFVDHLFATGRIE